MASPLIPAPTSARLSPAAQQRTLRWVLLGFVALAAFLVAVVGRPPAVPVERPPGPGIALTAAHHPGAAGPRG